MKIYSRAIWTLFFGIIGNGYLLAQTKVIINESILGKQIDDSFVGFSFNPAYSSQYFSTNYNGSNTRAISVQLFENFKNLQKPSVRIIGANNSYWRNASNFPNAPQNWNNNPNDIPLNYFPTTTPVFSTVIDQTDLDNFQGFFSSLSFAVPCILGINSSVIDKNRTIDMAKVSKSTLISPSSLEFEIGNEPDAFISNSRRLNGYGLTQYLQEYNYLADAIKNYGQAAAPALAKTNTGSWVDDIGNFLDQGTNLSTLTYHDYPLGNNNISTNTTSYLNKFLLDKYTKGVADGIITSINAASQKNKKLRMGEINTIAAGGNYGSSNSFGAALWVIDLMYELAKGGASGVNIATEGGSKTCYSPFEYRSDLLKSGNKVWVRPIYYGMLMFARAVPNSSKLLPVNFTTTVNPDQIKIWATKDKNQNTRIMLINRGTSINDQSITPIEISLDKRIQAAKYTLLEANGGIADTSNVTLGGQKIDLNSGEIKAANNLIISPENIGNTSTYKIDLKAGTAVLLEILANQNPTDILLSNNSIAENVPANTLIGTLSTIDQDLNDTFTYTLVAGQGDANNNDFSINENQLKIKNSPNFEGKNTYSVRLRATDFAGAFTEKVFSIQITDLNEA
ncbi:cadherin repeat domain-containing protein, partial [Daejeonella sp.]|uniref:cadherin repeat domain-containing protein n=1 Tax=Daejeonella sp. TaxID=2805397 RepID=UPI0037C0EB46